MKGRRTAALLCVLLVHALVIYSLLHLQQGRERATAEAPASEPITVYLPPSQVVPSPDVPRVSSLASPRLNIAPPDIAIGVPAEESSAVTVPGRVDWPIEGKKSAARVLAAEAEAERIARMFAGPGGTWASLTKRQRSKLSKFKWKPGVDGLERDEHGNTIYQLPNGCTIVNFMFFGCPIGKPKVNDDMFDNMRLYFDEQRLPYTDEGNGTEKGAQPVP
jgi:hypothetical protein